MSKLKLLLSESSKVTFLQNLLIQFSTVSFNLGCVNLVKRFWKINFSFFLCILYRICHLSKFNNDFFSITNNFWYNTLLFFKKLLDLKTRINSFLLVWFFLIGICLRASNCFFLKKRKISFLQNLFLKLLTISFNLGFVNFVKHFWKINFVCF